MLNMKSRIEAMDLVGRKVGRDGGRVISAVIRRMREVQVELQAHANAELQAIGERFDQGIGDLQAAVESLVKSWAGGPKPALAGSVPFLELLGIVAGGRWVAPPWRPSGFSHPIRVRNS